MTLTDQTRELVARFSGARAANDVAAVAALLDEEAEWHAPQSIRPRPIRGRDRVARALTGASTGAVLRAESIEREVTSTLVDGETAVVRQLMTATRIDGEPYRNDYCWIYTFRDGLLVRLDEYGDTLLIARAGFVPLQADPAVTTRS
ncbi:nuclear transport factor 2 family protein [Nocardia alni]|uniref:nuclear transport factor 2 family protein n=1 Tax=Nocardia alni TaxID=2815723 RepID=UPI001C216A0A|nr:nuclear transport factor 2 family protein [Nocardia alni]